MRQTALMKVHINFDDVLSRSIFFPHTCDYVGYNYLRVDREGGGMHAWVMGIHAYGLVPVQH